MFKAIIQIKGYRSKELKSNLIKSFMGSTSHIKAEASRAPLRKSYLCSAIRKQFVATKDEAKPLNADKRIHKNIVTMKRGVLLLTILLMVSCATRHTATRASYAKKEIETTMTPIFLPPDSALVKAQLQCDSMGKVYIKQINTLTSKNATLTMTLDSLGMLSTKMEVMYDTIYLPSTRTTITKCDTVKVYEKAINKKSAKKRLPLWQKIKCTINAFVCLLITGGVIYVAVRIIRKRKTFINY
ncbi:MAG: hypothetical protein ACI3ZZ_03805 [Candidatus Aphodosoma sp.]